MEDDLVISAEDRQAKLDEYRRKYLEERRKRFGFFGKELHLADDEDEAPENETPQTTQTTHTSHTYGAGPELNLAPPPPPRPSDNLSPDQAPAEQPSALQTRIQRAVDAEAAKPTSPEQRTVASVLGGAVTLDLSNPIAFATTPVPRGAQVQCYIIRSKGGLRSMFSVGYECFLQADDTFIVAAKKESTRPSTHFSFSTERKKFDKSSNSYLGKLRANFIGTEFTLYDNGKNPAKEPTADVATYRKELSVVTYESNLMSSKGPRKMTVLLPIVRDDDSTACWRPTKPVEGLLANYKSSCTEQMTTLINRAPKWNDQLAAYVLNFNGRVTMPSVKNFQLVHEGLDEVVLQFGKTGKDHFTMDFTWPMSPVQAFSVCISALDNKLMCE